MGIFTNGEDGEFLYLTDDGDEIRLKSDDSLVARVISRFDKDELQINNKFNKEYILRKIISDLPRFSKNMRLDVNNNYRTFNEGYKMKKSIFRHAMSDTGKYRKRVSENTNNKRGKTHNYTKNDTDFSKLRDIFTKNLKRLNEVSHNKYDIIKEDYNGFSNRETYLISESLTSDDVLIERALLFMGSYTGNQPYRDFIQSHGLGNARINGGIGWIDQKLNYHELNKIMKQLRGK